MQNINTETHLKIILLFSLLNSSIFMVFSPNGVLRLIIVALMNISGILLVTYFFKISKRNFDTNLYFKSVFTLLLIWTFFTIIRSFSFDQRTLMTLFGHYVMVWSWLTPLAIVFGFKISNWLGLFNFFSKILIVGAIYAFVGFFYKYSILTAYGLLEWMAFFPLIFFLTYFYHSNTNKIIVLVTLASYLILTYFASQRSNLIFLALIIVFLIFEYFRQSKANLYFKASALVFMIIIGILSVLPLNILISDLSTNKELTVDTRTFLFEELFADMSNSEKFTGRGTLGTYYSPYFAYTTEHGLPGDKPTRSISEVGYLHIILKGGYIMLGLYLLILIPAVYLGIFKSNNILARMSGYYILSYLIIWIVSFPPVYSAEFLLLWMAAGTAISGSTRSIKDDDILILRKGKLKFARQ